MSGIRAGQGLLIVTAFFASILGGTTSALLGACGPFSDVAPDAFCPFVLEIFTLGITTGTTPTTYDPASAVSRLQMAAFLSRTVDRTLQRGNRRSSLGQFWTPKSIVLGLTTVGSLPNNVRSDGNDLPCRRRSTGSASWSRTRSGTASPSGKRRT